uniref:Uncharacterized protein n=1 Tax=Physcomitrium patens TaxID=3218 RepID=A0A2K1IZP9_PHYPA|nr:hypothetical protein PHYPA_022662 [Physcomitrium patens]
MRPNSSGIPDCGKTKWKQIVLILQTSTHLCITSTNFLLFPIHERIHSHKKKKPRHRILTNHAPSAIDKNSTLELHIRALTKSWTKRSTSMSWWQPPRRRADSSQTSTFEYRIIGFGNEQGFVDFELLCLQHTRKLRQLALNKARRDRQHAEQRMAEALKRMEEAERHWKIAEKREKFASEAADMARNDSSATEKEKLESQRLAVERLAAIERLEPRCESLERERDDLTQLQVENERVLLKDVLRRCRCCQ